MESHRRNIFHICSYTLANEQDFKFLIFKWIKPRHSQWCFGSSLLLHASVHPFSISSSSRMDYPATWEPRTTSSVRAGPNTISSKSIQLLSSLQPGTTSLSVGAQPRGLTSSLKQTSKYWTEALRTTCFFNKKSQTGTRAWALAIPRMDSKVASETLSGLVNSY
jgi:hypothetical protein